MPPFISLLFRPIPGLVGKPEKKSCTLRGLDLIWGSYVSPGQLWMYWLYCIIQRSRIESHSDSCTHYIMSSIIPKLLYISSFLLFTDKMQEKHSCCYVPFKKSFSQNMAQDLCDVKRCISITFFILFLHNWPGETHREILIYHPLHG